VDNGNGSQRAVRFGAFEADFATGELRKHGLRIKIQEKPLRLLEVLLETPGKLVTREELRERVWSSDVYVDFDRNLKIALNKLRTALCDSAESPRYIETLPRHGYRFIAAVERVNGNGALTAQSSDAALPAVSPPTNGDGASTAAAVYTLHSEPGLEVRRNRSVWLWAAALLLVTAAAIAVLFYTRPPAKAHIGFHQRDWVLVSRFENRTGEPVLDGTVDFAVARELSNSRFVGVVPPQRVGDDLRLMRKPAATPLDPELAREICQRDGGIRALITGRVEKIGTTYVLSGGIVDPTTDAQVAGVEAQAADLNGVVPAVRRLSDQLRESLGESLPSVRESNLKLEKVTTPSLHALQLYSQAMTLAIQEPAEKPIPLLEQAVAEDPNFASAHNLLAWCYSNIGKWELAAPHFRKAFALAETVSERERLFILASYYGRFEEEHEKVKGGEQKALQAYEVLAHLYPDDYWGVGNLASLLQQRGRTNEATDLIQRLADLRPGDFISNYDAWNRLAQSGRQAEATGYLARARSLLTTEIETEYPGEATNIETADALRAVRSWDAHGALVQIQRLAATYEAKNGAMRNVIAFAVGEMYLDLGKLKTAEEWFRKFPPDGPGGKLAAIELGEEHGTGALRSALRKQLPLTETPYGYGTVVRLARCGMLKEARQLLSRLKTRDGDDNRLVRNSAEGGLALYEGRQSQAVTLLKQAMKGWRKSLNNGLAPNTWAPHAANLLATAYEQRGRVSDAIQTLQPFEDKHALDVQTSFHLFKLYEKAHDTQNAQEIRQNLLQRLAYADPDFPILVQLRQQMTVHAGLISKPQPPQSILHSRSHQTH
jgi:DNA-binding winged helix-turn-helix (wHTH) protein/tetratricopeptide (TPR) repeat protein